MHRNAPEYEVSQKRELALCSLSLLYICWSSRAFPSGAAARSWTRLRVPPRSQSLRHKSKRTADVMPDLWCKVQSQNGVSHLLLQPTSFNQETGSASHVDLVATALAQMVLASWKQWSPARSESCGPKCPLVTCQVPL